MQIKELNDILNELHEDFLQLLGILKDHCWLDRKEKEKKVKSGGIFNLDLDETITIHQKLIPKEYLHKYQRWFSLCKGILEVNADKECIQEFNKIYNKIVGLQDDNYITLEGQKNLTDLLDRQFYIVTSLPDYLRGKSHSLKMTIASMLMGDELKEARLLFKKGFIRAAGALSGVILERHLKFRMDESTPKIKYVEKATLGQLIKKAEENSLFEHTTIQKLKYLNSVRIKCDHDKKPEPKKNEVEDLIEQTNKFIHFMDD